MSGGYLSEIFVSFQGEGAQAGRRHLFIRTAGCNLRCRYCDQPESLERTAVVHVRNGTSPRTAPNPITPRELIDHARAVLSSTGPVDGTSLTGGEPLLQAEFLAETLSTGQLPRPYLLETHGALPDRLPRVLPWIDVVSMDVKLPSNTGEAPWWDAHARFLALARGKAYVKVLVDAGTALDEVERAARLVRECDPTAPVFLQPITRPDGQVDVDAAALARFFDRVKAQVSDVRVIPQLHKMLAIQ